MTDHLIEILNLKISKLEKEHNLLITQNKMLSDAAIELIDNIRYYCEYDEDSDNCVMNKSIDKMQNLIDISEE